MDLGDTGRTTDEDDLVDGALLDGSILKNLGDGLQGTLEGLGVQVLETSTGNLEEEILAIKERVNLNGGLSTVGQSALGTLASSPESPERAGVAGDI